MAKKKAEQKEEQKKDDKEKKEDSSENGEEIAEKPDKSDLFAKIDKDARVIVDKYKDKGIKISTIIEDAIDLYDLYHSFPPELRAIMDQNAPKEVEIEGLNPEYAKYFKVIEDGLKLLGQHELKDSGMAEDKDLWSRARSEMKMMLIGKTTFNQLIRAAAVAPKHILEKPFKSNVALAIINWITSKAIKALSLEELLEAIKKMWVVANYFYIIEAKREEEEEGKEDEYLITFKHRQLIEYSNYWLGYFSELFTSDAFSFGCMVVDSEAFDEFFSLTIKKIYDKPEVEFDLKESSIEECVKSIKELYVKANLFTKIEIKKVDDESFLLIMEHNKNKRYSSFWLETFTRLFKSEDLAFKCVIEGEILDETLSLTIKKGYDKDKVESEVI